jgi:hypothetical protein
MEGWGWLHLHYSPKIYVYAGADWCCVVLDWLARENNQKIQWKILQIRSKDREENPGADVKGDDEK